MFCFLITDLKKSQFWILTIGKMFLTLKKEDQNSISEVILLFDNIQNLNSVKMVKIRVYLLYVTFWTALT